MQVLPPGVINFIPGRASVVGDICMSHPDLAGIHFTGSTAVFRKLWRDVANNLENLRSYPRIVGETGGKDFIVAHPNCDEEALIVALLRGAFEFQGQKCSAASRAYIPESVWSRIEAKYIEEVGKITMGDVSDFSNFIGAVIDKKSFDNITGYIDRAHADPGCSIVTGGSYDGSTGYFVEPTTIVCSDPMYESMQEEIFGLSESSQSTSMRTVTSKTFSRYVTPHQNMRLQARSLQPIVRTLKQQKMRFGSVQETSTSTTNRQAPLLANNRLVEPVEAVQTTRQEVH